MDMSLALVNKKMRRCPKALPPGRRSRASWRRSSGFNPARGSIRHKLHFEVETTNSDRHKAEPLVKPLGTVGDFDVQTHGFARFGRLVKDRRDERSTDALVAVFRQQPDIDKADFVASAVEKESPDWFVI